MCGIAGFFDPLNPDCHPTISSMVASLSHRGPDSQGVWHSNTDSLALGHARLALLDLSHLSNQPFTTTYSNSILTYNGEIYNHLDLRYHVQNADPSVEFLTNSDTESLYYALELLGIDKTLQIANGMFAFAYWSPNSHTLYLARDIFGEKPLYYHHRGSRFVFASELKSLFKYPSILKKINPTQLSYLFSHGFSQPSSSIYTSISKLPPGAYLTYSPRSTSAVLTDYRASTFPPAAREKHSSQLKPDRLSDTSDSIHRLLIKSVSSKLVADVPVGVFLSSGIDSSLVASIAANVSTSTLSTFSVSFSDSISGEALQASRIAQYLNTDHHTIYVTPESCLSTIQRLPLLLDEPFLDFSSIPTFLISEYASSHVKAVLGGDGADECFGGYRRYQRFSSLMKFWSLAGPFRSTLANFTDIPSTKISKLIRFLASPSAYSAYANFFTSSCQSLLAPQFRTSSMQYTPERECIFPLTRPYSVAMSHDIEHYLPNDILTKVDMMSMSSSLELRSPFLDPELIQFLRLSSKYSSPSDILKTPLRQILNQYLPKSLISTRKTGFSPPFHQWFNTPDYRSFFLDYLTPARVSSVPFLDHKHTIRLLVQYSLGYQANPSLIFFLYQVVKLYDSLL